MKLTRYWWVMAAAIITLGVHVCDCRSFPSLPVGQALGETSATKAKTSKIISIENQNSNENGSMEASLEVAGSKQTSRGLRSYYSYSDYDDDDDDIGATVGETVGGFAASNIKLPYGSTPSSSYSYTPSSYSSGYSSSVSRGASRRGLAIGAGVAGGVVAVGGAAIGVAKHKARNNDDEEEDSKVENEDSFNKYENN